MALSDRLNSPIKRVGFVVSIFGSLLFAASVIGYISNRRNYGVYVDEFFRESVLMGYWAHWYQILGGIGFWMAATGLLVVLFYDKTIGRLMLWIRFGSLRKP